MKPEHDTQDVTLLIEQARRHRGSARGAAFVAWILNRADAFLHRLLMSPVPNSKTLKEN